MMEFVSCHFEERASVNPMAMVSVAPEFHIKVYTDQTISTISATAPSPHDGLSPSLIHRCMMTSAYSILKQGLCDHFHSDFLSTLLHVLSTSA